MILAFALYIVVPSSVYSVVFAVAFFFLILSYAIVLIDKDKFDRKIRMEESRDALEGFAYTLDESYTDYGSDAVIINLESGVSYDDGKAFRKM